MKGSQCIANTEFLTNIVNIVLRFLLSQTVRTEILDARYTPIILLLVLVPCVQQSVNGCNKGVQRNSVGIFPRNSATICHGIP